MGRLTNAQYDQVMRLYSLQQSENARALSERTKAAYALIPELAQLDAQAGEMTMAGLRAHLADDPQGVEEAHASLRQLPKQRSALLKAHALPEDYLEMHYRCPDCEDTGYIGSQRCHCFSAHVVDLFYTQSGLREILQEENFDHFSLALYPDKKKDPRTGLTARENMRRVLQCAKDFVQDFISADADAPVSGKNLLLYGGTGLGKTFLSHCIAKELIEHSCCVMYYSAADLFERMADETFRRGDEAENISEYVLGCDLLIIDDLGTEVTNTFSAAALFKIINDRILMKKSTLINTNLSLSAFADIYTERVFSRITSNYILLGLYGDDIRLKRALGEK